MREMKDGEFQLAIVDPPYGLGNKLLKGGGNHTKSLVRFHWLYAESQWDKQPDNDYFEDLFRISQNQIIWGGNYFNLPPCRCFLIWDKDRKVENFSHLEYAWTSFDEHAQMFKFCNNAGFILSEEDRPRFHPTQKPVALYKWLLKNYAKPGDKILDTHGGSMSIAIACHDMGFDLTLYELDPDYFKAGKERLERHQQQGRLF
jgi:site-specific DNA-methyltransferase (adenine-specific)